MTERRVVVTTPPILYERSPTKAYAVRLEKMGLTAYGATQEEAWDAFKELFSVSVDFYRKRGTLERELNAASVEWHWVDEYDGEYEDVSGLAEDVSAPAFEEEDWGASEMESPRVAVGA